MSASQTRRIGAVNRLFLTPKGRKLVDDLDSLRDAIAGDVLRDIPGNAVESTLKTLVEMKERIKTGVELAVEAEQPREQIKARRSRARS